MILQCPQCESRFVLPAKALLPDGRKVKCSSCANVWHQAPDLEELKSLAEAPASDIPAAVKPIPEGSNVPVVQDVPEEKFWQTPRFGGYAAAFAVFLILLIPALMLTGGEKIDYSALGFKNVSVKVIDATDVEETLTFSGTLSNVSGQPLKVPYLKFELLDNADAVIDRWHSTPVEDTIDPNEEITFSMPHATQVKGGDELRVVFISEEEFKTVSAGAGSIRVQSQVDPHPHAGAEAEGSPAPAVAPPHPESSH
jgi:predicted Zn finger-like uncharacterized protein